jgi:hypothetical protein
VCYVLYANMWCGIGSGSWLVARGSWLVLVLGVLVSTLPTGTTGYCRLLAMAIASRALRLESRVRDWGFGIWLCALCWWLVVRERLVVG